jgi:transposase
MIHKILFVGLDISKLKHDVVIMNENKQPLGRPFVIRENRIGYQSLIDRLDQLKEKYQTQTFYIGMEATADYWKNIYHFLKQSKDFIPVVINPVQTKAFAKTELRRAKTDPVNAKDIAQYLVEKRPQSSWTRPPIFDHIKDLDTQLRALGKQKTMALNRLRVELGKVAPEIEQNIRNICGQQILALLMEFPTAETISKASTEELGRIRYGKKQWSLSAPFISRMKTLSQDSIAHKSGFGAGLVVQALVRLVIQLQKEMQILKEQMEQLYEKTSDEQSILTSINGVGKETAIVLEAYFGDVNRFPDSRKFVAHFGMNPTVSMSGKTGKRISHLEKKGSGIVRHKLFMITLNMISRKQEPIYSYYQRLVAAGKIKMVAMVAAMRKLLVIMYIMLKNREKFDPQKNSNQ